MSTTGGRISVRSCAKVNLGLEVLGRRADGFHEISTILHEVTVCDEFIWTATSAPFTYQSPHEIDAESDLVRRALDLAPDREAWTGSLSLQKHVPISAGLGGGSSNAALALQLAFPGPIDKPLVEHATRLGSDVPFFLRGGTSLATGTGTTLQSLPTPDLWFVIVVPNVTIAAKTASMYARLNPEDYTDGSQSQRIADAITRGSALPAELPNAFLKHVPDSPAFCRARRAMIETVGQCVMSGAGPALFAVFPRRDVAMVARTRLQVDIGWIAVAASVSSRVDRSLDELARAIRGTIHL